MKTLVITLLVLLLMLTIGLLTLFYQQQKKEQTINSFEQCVAAGNPTMESYPPQCVTKDKRSFTQNIGNALELADHIRVSSPRPGQVLTTPLAIKGEARGTWFFEAEAVAKLIDENNVVLAMEPITAQGEWMTENFVPFTGKLDFKKSTTKTGTLIIEKANPSGLPQHAEQLIIPILFE